MGLDSKLQYFYNQNLIGIIEPLEKYRKKNADKYNNNLKWAYFCIPIMLAGFLSSEPFLILLSTLPSILFFARAYSIYNKMVKYLRYRYKHDVLNRLISQLFEKFEYIARQKIAKQVLVKSMLFPSYIAGVQGEDFMQFKLGGVHIMFCETVVYKSRDKIMFKGVFISSSFNKLFNAKIFILSKGLSNFILRIKGQLTGDLKKVNLEDVEFNNYFTTISNDQVDARYVLSTSLMKRLVDYKQKINKEISFSFVENRLYCVIPNFNDLFEPPFLKSLDFEWIKKALEPVFLYTGLVEDLNLNLRIWSKP